MKIIKIHINEFGPLRSRDFDFGDKLTIVTGENESGKSSLLLFIKFALYGLSKRAKIGSATEIEKALAHDSAKASGYMIVSHEGKEYRIDRYIGKASRTFTEKVQVTLLETSEVCDYGNSPGEFFLGIPTEIFENSCGVSQLGCSALKGEQTGTAIRNILSSADESIDSAKAIKSLDAVRIKYLHKNKTGGSIQELSLQLEELRASYEKAVDDECETERMQADLNKLDTTIADVLEKQKIADELSSKITLRSVIKLFDKLHEYEAEKKSAKEESSAINEKLEKNGTLIDRKFLASLFAAKSELCIANEERAATRRELDYVLSQTTKETEEILRKTELFGGIDALRTFKKKSASSIKAKAILSVVFAVLFAVFGALPFIGIVLPTEFFSPSLALSALSAMASVTFIILRGQTITASKKRCLSLDIDYDKLSDFIGSAEKALCYSSETESKAMALREVLLIKERVLSAAKDKCQIIIKKYYATCECELSFEELCKHLDEISLEATALCDRQDALATKISSLSTNIKELAAELSDYNEHQTRGKVSDKILSMTEEEIKEAKKEKSFHDLQLKALTEKKLATEKALLERRYTTNDPFDIAARIAKTESLLDSQSKTLNSLVLAIEALETASTNLRGTITPKIRALSNEYMSRLTDGKYDTVTVSDSLEMSMNDNGFSYHIDTFSTGTKDAAYLALRLSLLSLLPSSETPPMLMDETLAMIDDKRAKKLLSMLSDHSKNKGQCILFCCHDREERLCREENIEFSSITM